MRLNDRDFDLPLLHLDGSDVLHIQFDEMSHDVRSYSYRVLHCDADWTPSALASGEYLAGFPTGMISEYALSTTTTYPYTNYKLSVPNDDMSFTKSGNYVLQVYEDNDPDHPVEPLDIVRVNRLMYATAFLALVLCCGVPLLVSLAL